jgi:hypothetical protein
MCGQKNNCGAFLADGEKSAGPAAGWIDVKAGTVLLFKQLVVFFS